MNDVREYYNSIASYYDHDRFANSYGKFIDAEERIILHNWLNGIDKKFILDYGCGTDRLTNFATIGADVSEAMLSVAKQKNPKKKFHLI
jgi:ubiquinone/menaquinone biosynthesis C-methylase UbiE